MADNNPPRPYLTREETNERLQTLGFEFNLRWQIKDTPKQRTRFRALQELIAGAIADWAAVEGDITSEEDFPDIDRELLDFSQAFLNQTLLNG